MSLIEIASMSILFLPRRWLIYALDHFKRHVCNLLLFFSLITKITSFTIVFVRNKMHISLQHAGIFFKRIIRLLIRLMHVYPLMFEELL